VRILLLTVSYPNDVAFYSDWVEAFSTHPKVLTEVANIAASDGKACLRRQIREADAIVALHATTSDWLLDLTEVAPILLDRKIPLGVFIGNEFNQPFPWLAEKIEVVKQIRTDIVFSQLLQETAEWLYAETGARVLSLPHALNHRRFRPGPDYLARRLDLVSRSYRYPVYLGDNQRNDVFTAASRLQGKSDWTIDVRLGARADASTWADLLRDSRATIATEAGTWFLERDDCTAREVERRMRLGGRAGFALPNWLRRGLRRLPSAQKDLLRRAGSGLAMTYAPLATPDARTAKAIAEIFATAPKPPVYGKCIAARNFDALGTKTLQLLTPGRYNDIMKPGEHYLEIAADASNLEEILESAQNPAIWTRITEAGYALGLSSTYAVRINELLSQLFAPSHHGIQNGIQCE